MRPDDDRRRGMTIRHVPLAYHLPEKWFQFIGAPRFELASPAICGFTQRHASTHRNPCNHGDAGGSIGRWLEAGDPTHVPDPYHEAAA